MPWVYINSLALCHNLDCMGLDCLLLHQDIILIHYTGDIMLSETSEQEVATTVDLFVPLVRHFHVRGWVINSTKIQWLLISVKFLVVQLNLSRYPF